MKLLYWLMFWLSLPFSSLGQISPVPSGRSTCCDSRYSRAQLDSLPLNELGREYRRIRSVRCEACDHFGSDLMLVMSLLGERLNGTSKRTIKSVMGRADARENGTLIYHWRSRHDYLEFTFGTGDGGISHWYHAYE